MCDGLQVIYDGLKHWKVHVMLHGGDIYRNDIVLDFSVNINPLGRPAEVDEAIRQAFFAIENYPDPRHEKLLSALALYAELPEKSVIAGNGASELIMAVMRLFQGSQFVFRQACYISIRIWFTKSTKPKRINISSKRTAD